MKYLKVWVSFRKALEPYDDAERGRLFTAMLAYAESGEEPNFSGNERFIWGQVKETIDLTRETSEKRRQSGSTGGTAAAANNSKTEQNTANDSKTDQPEASDSSKEKKGKEKKGNLKELIDEEDDDDDVIQREEDMINAIQRAFPTFCGRTATPAETGLIANRAMRLGFSPPMTVRAIEEAGKNGAQNIQAYTGSIFEDWKYEGIKTPEEVDELRALRDGATGKNPLLDPARCEEEMTENRHRRRAGGE